jgi:hypothetical protein
MVTPEQRLKAFGHHEHVRIPGKDYHKRLEQVGFTVKTLWPVDEFSSEEYEKYGLENQPVFLCTK